MKAIKFEGNSNEKFSDLTPLTDSCKAYTSCSSSNLFYVCKIDVRICSKSKLAILVMGFVLSSMFDIRLFKARNRVFEFDY